jgi:hypothetical protein
LSIFTCKYPVLKKFKKILLWFFLSLLFLLIAAWIFIQTPAGQRWIGRIVVNKLSRQLNTRISIGHIDFSLFNRMHLGALLVEDHSGDTLLYAGLLKVRITDWFFFKKNVELKYAGLEDAVIKLQRTDSVWRHQFLVDYFSSSSSSGSRKGRIALDIKKVELKRVMITQKDAWMGKDMAIRIGALTLDAREINFSKKTAFIHSLSLAGPEVSLYKYKRLKPPTKKIDPGIETGPDSSYHWNPEGWIVQLNKLTIRDGIFRDGKESLLPVLESFDGKHIEFNSIDGNITDVRLIKDTITAKFDLKTKERSGFEVKKFLADASFNPQSMRFDNLDIKTNKSSIRDFFMMSYNDFDDMDDFIHKVRMTADFKETEIDSDDIAFFAPGLKNWKKKFTVQGKASGTVDELTGKELVIQAGNHTLLKGDISLTGLPDIDLTFIDFRARDFRTNYSDAATFIPVLRNVKEPDLRKLQTIHFTGTFTGFLRDFVTFGTFQTNLGTVKTDLNMKFPKNRLPVYSGNISTYEFRLGELLGEKDLGSVGFDGLVKGSGFSEKNRNVNLDGDVFFIDYHLYRYSNIKVKGWLNKLFFDGFASIKDPNLDLMFNGLFDLNPESTAFDVLVNVQKANLRELKILKDSLSFNGNLKFNFTGGNIDEFLGRARITDASVYYNGKRLPFDSLVLTSVIENEHKKLSLFSNEFDGSITGQFNVKELPAVVSLFLNKYYPSYVRAPATKPRPQSFNFNFTTLNVDEYIRLFDKHLSGFDYGQVSGRLDLNDNIFELEASFPDFTYKQFVFSDAEISGKGDLEKLVLTGRAGHTTISDSIYLPETKFSIVAANDVSKINIKATANQPVNNADINAVVKTYADGVTILVDSSTFSLQGKQWIIEKDGILNFRSDSIAEGQIVLRSGIQEIRLKTEPSKLNNRNDLNITLKEVSIGDFSPFFMPRNRLEGIVTGTVHIEDPYRKFNISSDFRAERMLLDNDSLGNITAVLEYDHASGKLTAKGRNLDTDKKIEFDMTLFLKGGEMAKQNRISARTESYPINILERFLGELFTDVHGYVTGPLELTGPLEELNFSGKVMLKDAGLKVKFTQCYYKIQDKEIVLTPGIIDLNGILLTDPVTGNPVYLSGDIYHTSFKNMFFDLTASTRRPFTTDPNQNRPILLLNTNAKDNERFYGKAFGTGLFSLTGPESEMFMKIDAIASSRDSSNITILSYTGRESGIADFLVERKFGREMADLEIKKSATNMIYDVDVVGTPAVNVTVVLDELTGDIIKGRGEGAISIHSGTNEPVQMRGRFNILDGNYTFTFQSLFKKPFVLRKGSDNFIEWTDDPYDARIQFDAVYIADNVNFSPLVTAFNLDPSLNRYRDDVYVVARLSGKLFSPDFDFSLDFPPNSKAKNDPSLAFNIQQIEKNPNEINRQVTYLIVFNSFAPLESSPTSGGSFGSTISELAYSTISSLSGLFFSQISRELNKALSKIFNTDNVGFNLSGSVYNRNLLEQQNKNTFSVNQGNVNFTLPVSLFKDRFILTLGGGLDVPLQTAIQNEVRFLPDVTAEWLINEKGTVRATFFYRENLDLLTGTTGGSGGRTKRSGASISYRKDFDRLREFFENPGKGKAHPKEELPANDDNK